MVQPGRPRPRRQVWVGQKAVAVARRVRPQRPARTWPLDRRGLGGLRGRLGFARDTRDTPGQAAVETRDVTRDRVGFGGPPHGLGDLDDVVSVAEAAAELGVSAQAVRQRLESGTLAGRKAGRAWHVSREAVLAAKARQMAGIRIRRAPVARPATASSGDGD